MPDWRKIGSALTAAEAALPGNAKAPADRWLAVIAKTLALDPLEGRVLALALHCRLDKRAPHDAQLPRIDDRRGARRSNAGAAIAIFAALRPFLHLGAFDRAFSNPPVAELSLYVVILALLFVLF